MPLFSSRQQALMKLFMCEFTVECAMTAVRYDKRLGTFYERLKRKGSAKAIVATAKEILVIVWYMLTRRELYRSMNKEEYQQKLSRINNIKQSLV